ncbi:MAG TPA: peptide chain release factor N(5)-glutamine methyltransferase, partial [Chryseosolibacter sp.]
EKIPVYGLDIIESNPPYVAESESREMKPNVLQFEPHLALFAPDEDPLVFYREITRKAKVTLRPSGLLAVEINERFGNEVSQLFIDNGFRAVEVIPDVSGKSRVVRGERAT